MISPQLSRRDLLRSFASWTALSFTVGMKVPGFGMARAPLKTAPPYAAANLLKEYDYGAVQLADSLPKQQFEQTLGVIMKLDEDSLLRPFRMRAGLPAPGLDLGGWYDYWDGTDIFHEIERGFAPGHAFGQWVSALARSYAITGKQEMKEKMQRLIAAYAQIPAAKYYKGLRYPGYTYDKLVCALLDAKKWADQKDAYQILDKTTDAIVTIIPEKAFSHDEYRKLPHEDESYCWDETYTMPENLYLAYQQGAGDRYLTLADKYLMDETFFNPLAEGKNVLPGHHAYSYVNALSSSMQAYLTTGSEKHLQASKNAFDMLQATQSFATGGWGPNESFVYPGKGYLAKSLNDSHKSFETPCGAYAHLKLTRYLLRVTRNARYGDSLEQVLYNTVLGAKPLQVDGRGFYYSDYNFYGQKYYRYAWTCCTGSLPQVVADYHISGYFHDDEGIYVNLYIPSTLKATQKGVDITLTQTSNYPFEGNIEFNLQCAKPTDFTLHFRIPEWAGPEATLLVNGKKTSGTLIPRKFAAINRTWNDNDKVQLTLPMTLRVVPIAPESKEIVALMYGPLALFAITEKQPIATTSQLLAAKRIGKDEWQVESSDGPLTMKPFTSITKEQYSLYLNTVKPST